MSSERKRETARLNGAKSLGPITPEGKARSSANSRLHGLASVSILMREESEEHFNLLQDDFLSQFQPQTAVETELVETMVTARWRLRRLLAIETRLFDLEITRRQADMDKKLRGMDSDDRLAYVFQELSNHGNALALLLRYEASINRSYDKALKQLQALQSARPLGSFCNSGKDETPTPEPLRVGPPTTPCPQAGGEPAPDPSKATPSPRGRQNAKAKGMSVRTVASKFVELCKAGKNFDVMRTMYAPDIVSVEADAKETAGQGPVIKKSEDWVSDKTFNGETVAGPFFNGASPDQFAVFFTLDVTSKASGKRTNIEEVGVYTVKNDLITREQFFYDGAH